MSPDKLAHMANQIGLFFQTQKRDSAVESIADHLLKFWDPRMRRDIARQAQEPGGKLDPLVREAVERLADGKHT